MSDPGIGIHIYAFEMGLFKHKQRVKLKQWM